MITNHGKGNPELVNLPRKINIGISSTRDDFAHTHINDVGLYAAKDPETGKVMVFPLGHNHGDPGGLQSCALPHASKGVLAIGTLSFGI